MTPERWRQIEGVVEAALQRPSHERSLYLKQTCGNDLELAREVSRLLDAYGRADDFLVQPPTELLHLPSSHGPGSQVGDYTLLEPIGEGGMGVVFLAERNDGAYQQRVAVKIIKRGLETDRVVERFRLERQILADLNHPAIARLFDGGATEDGSPYLVMEHVDGMPIDTYCDSHRLDIDARLQWMHQVCLAVHHAHSNLVVHRDLKPGHILIERSGEGLKLLDFGIAKLLSPAPSQLQTQGGQRLMTPAFASPEQWQGDSVGTATDIYSLGIVFFKLLSGHMPYELDRSSTTLTQPSFDAPRRRLSDLDDDTPSQAAADARRTTVSALKRRLKGDLETILDRAMAAEPDRRYASVLQLAEDLDRHRRHLPVLARPDGWSYRVGRFVRRHRVAVLAASLTLVTLLALSTTMTWQAFALAEERDRVVQERDRAQRVTQFFADVFALARPDAAGAAEISPKTLLDRGLASHAAALDDQPHLQATVFLAAGDVYRSIGAYGEAEQWLQRSLQYRQEHLEPNAPATADVLVSLALLERERGSLERAEGLLNQAQSMLEQSVAAQDPRLADIWAYRAWFHRLRGELDVSEELVREALQVHRQAMGPESLALTEDLTQLAEVARLRGQLDEAEDLLQQAATIQEKTLGAAHPALLSTLKTLAQTLTQAQRHDEAVRHLERILDGERQIYGEQHARLGFTLNHLGLTLLQSGDLDSAERRIREGLDMRRQVHGDSYPAVGVSLSALGLLQRRQGQLEASEASYQEALDILRRGLPAGSPGLAHPLVALAEVLLDQGRPDAAEPLLREALSIRQRASERPALVTSTASALRRSLEAQGKTPEPAIVKLAAETEPIAGPRSTSR